MTYEIDHTTIEVAYFLALSSNQQYIAIGELNSGKLGVYAINGDAVPVISHALDYEYLEGAAFTSDAEDLLSIDTWGNIRLYERHVG